VMLISAGTLNSVGEFRHYVSDGRWLAGCILTMIHTVDLLDMECECC